MKGPNPSRRRILAGIGAISMRQSIRATTPAEADSPAMPQSEAGFSSDLEARLNRAIADKRVWNLHGVVILRNGHPVLERYFEGDDNLRGRPWAKSRSRPIRCMIRDRHRRATLACSTALR